VPPSDGKLRIQFPEGFDIATSGAPKCTIGVGDMSFDNFPCYWTGGYSHTVATHCKRLKTRTVEVRMNAQTLREFYSLKEGKCAFIVLTTTGATGGTQGSKGLQRKGGTS
jgi:hypothetical protein